jgi:Glycosyl hydrolase family 12
MNPATITFLATAFLVNSAANGASPVFVTSDRNGGWADGGYYVHNNLWNSAKYTPCTSTLCASSFDDWYVVARMNNKSGDGAVKTYPNVHKDYPNVPVRSFDSITSTFAENSPHVGIYNVTYDIWINGIATPDCTEIMIWTENFKQTPGGHYVQELAVDGRTYKVYKRSNTGYIAFVAKTNFTAGTVNLLEFMNWAIAKGWCSSNSILNQICFGFETVSTDDADGKFQVSTFSIAAKSKPPSKSVFEKPHPL